MFVWVRWSLIVLLVQGNFVVAARFYQTVLNMEEAVFGSSHPEVARDLLNLGTVQSLQVIPSVSSLTNPGLLSMVSITESLRLSSFCY